MILDRARVDVWLVEQGEFGLDDKQVEFVTLAGLISLGLSVAGAEG